MGLVGSHNHLTLPYCFLLVFFLRVLFFVWSGFGRFSNLTPHIYIYIYTFSGEFLLFYREQHQHRKTHRKNPCFIVFVLPWLNDGGFAQRKAKKKNIKNKKTQLFPKSFLVVSFFPSLYLFLSFLPFLSVSSFSLSFFISFFLLLLWFQK